VADRLRPDSDGARVRLKAGQPQVTDAIVEPQEVTFTIRGARAELTAGLGRVVWGRLDELQPTDVVNPLDLSRFFFEGRSEARLAVPLVRGRLFAGEKASLEAIYVPFFRRARFDRLDEPTSPFNLAPTTAVEDRSPARIAANAQGGARVNVTTGRVDWSVSAYDGWTSLVLSGARPARVVSGLLTGLHEPEASHLDLLESVAGGPLVDRAYADITASGAPHYLWHEFGDSMLLLP